MDYYIKCFLYFLLGFILHLLLKGKIVEGFQNELSLLLNISKNREDIGCQNYDCSKHGYYYKKKINLTDENSILCNNSHPDSLVSLLNTGNRCNKELCCESIKCEDKFFKKGYNCGDRRPLYFNTCDITVNDDECQNVCCGTTVEKAESIFDDIIIFRNSIRDNSGIEEDLPYYNEYSFSNDNLHMNLIHLRNYMYYNILDIDFLKTQIDGIITNGGRQTISGIQFNLLGRNAITSTNIEPDDSIKFYDFETINMYLTDIYNHYISSDDLSSEEKLTNIKQRIDPNILQLNIIPGVNEPDNQPTISEYLSNLGDSDIFSGYMGILVSKNKRINNFKSFIENYTQYDETTQSNDDNSTLQDAFRKSMIILSQHSFISGDSNKTPLDTFGHLSSSDDYKTFHQRLDNFQILF
tara:strand:+ start:4117 stop:5346 length:1230 start_codon:yes stop_codon:yes gene_type:complete